MVIKMLTLKELLDLYKLGVSDEFNATFDYSEITGSRNLDAEIKKGEIWNIILYKQLSVYIVSTQEESVDVAESVAKFLELIKIRCVKK